jgi:hypothetical protein
MIQVGHRAVALTWALALSLACETTHEQAVAVGITPTLPQPRQPPEVVEPAAEPDPPAPPPRPAPPVVGQAPRSDELLLLMRGTCHAHTGRTEGCEPVWRGLVRTPGHPQFVSCEIEPSGLDAPKSRQLLRGQIDVRPFEDTSHRHRCEIVRVDETLAPEDHGVQPLDAYSLGPVDIGITAADQELDVPELERGFLRVFVGLESGRLLVASAYLQDLGPLLAIPGRELITTKTLRADFEAALQRGDRVGRVGGAKSFAPQVADRAERMSYAYTPILSTAAPGGEIHETHRWDHASVVPLRAADGRRYLVVSFGVMKSSWESAKRRGQMIVRIVEDDLHPDESAAK